LTVLCVVCRVGGTVGAIVTSRVGGTVGAIVTSPLDVVKTRLQSSCASWNSQSKKKLSSPLVCPNTGRPINPNRKVFFATRLNVSNY